MSKIKIIDSEYSDEVPNSRMTEVIASYNGFRRGITRNNYPNFMEQVYKRTKFFIDLNIDKKVTTSTLFDLIEREIFTVEYIPICVICEEHPIMPLREGGLSDCCSISCAAKLSCKNSGETNLRVRGVSHHARDPEVRKKTKKTLYDRYDGASCPMDIPGAKKRAMETQMRKRGEPHHMKIPENVDKIVSIQKTVEGSIHHPEYHEHRRLQDSIRGYSKYIKDPKAYRILNDPVQLEQLINSMSHNDIADFLGVCRASVSRYTKKHGIPLDRFRFGNRSSGEIRMEEFIKTIYEGEIISSYRGLGQDCEIDIYLPDIGLGIEYNGVFYHSMNPRNIDTHTKNRHLIKTIRAKDNGIRLLHVFEDEWLHRKDQVKNKIKSIVGVYDRVVHGRKTVPNVISGKEAAQFFEQHHIQGKSRGFFYCGLFLGDELVAAMSFSKTRSGIELTRFATSCKVHGGFSKLVKFFELNNPDVDRIVSFADRRWSEGNVYESNGFSLEKISYPDYKYVVDDTRVHKSRFRKERMEKVLKNYNKNLTEFENAWNHGLYRIYDCGLMKFVKDL